MADDTGVLIGFWSSASIIGTMSSQNGLYSVRVFLRVLSCSDEAEDEALGALLSLLLSQKVET